MKNNLIYFMAVVFFALTLSACKKDKNRTSGICYCEFFSGDKSQYDLRHLDRNSQIDTCNNHNKNAANFGGECELE